ncbi:MAG: ABC transporter ATP-binding protein [Planctomycetes bacterium]|nr:ABC transporter ATP-binding protein [Planctomycetota bacterium]
MARSTGTSLLRLPCDCAAPSETWVTVTESNQAPRTDAPPTALFELEGLVVRYGRNTVIPGLTVRVEPGAVGLLGPNGAGKSSLIKTILGLIKPGGGSVKVLGLDIPCDALEVRRRVGYMPESAVVFPGMTGIENVAYAGAIAGMPRGEARRRAHEVLEYVGCGEERYRSIDEYSQGMRQRIKLASALVHDPELLLLDEPTNGLDPGGRTEILELVRDLGHQKGMSILLSSHLLDDVESVCDHVLLLARGELKADGSIKELEARVAGEHVRMTLEGDAARFLAQARERGFEPHLPDPLDPSECLVKLPAGATPGAILKLAIECGVRVRRFVPQRPSLETVFLDTLEQAGGPR